jgi:hypothetical protein
MSSLAIVMVMVMGVAAAAAVVVDAERWKWNVAACIVLLRHSAQQGLWSWPLLASTVAFLLISATAE